MAGNRRGRLKERLEGIHKNFDWIINHCNECTKLIGKDNDFLSNGIKELGKAAQTLDNLAQEIYCRL